MKKIIITIIVLILLGFVGFQVYEYKVEKELEAFVVDTSKKQESQTATTTEASTVKKISLTEISKHNVKADCWMSINGQVLDVTTFVDKHPGGEVILQGCGKDATPLFSKVPGHDSAIVKMLLKKLSIGELE